MRQEEHSIKNNYGRLAVQSRSGTNKYGDSTWTCLCECGKEIVASIKNLRSGKIVSCGCQNIKKVVFGLPHHNVTHGFCVEPYRFLFGTYKAMISRCHNIRNKNYKHYGSRGIKVCDEWRNDFMVFFNDMYPKPQGMSLDRIDNSLGYSKANCKWSTPLEQINNRRNTIMVEYNGDTIPASELAKRKHVPYYMITRSVERNKDVLTELLNYKPKKGKCYGSNNGVNMGQ